MMIPTKSFALTALALCLAVGQPALAAGPHAHEGPTATARSQLDHGKKWPTDDVLRRGMTDIALAIRQSLAPIHSNVFTPAQYEALAARIQAQVDDVVANCKLPEPADQQLHLVLEQIIDGAAKMKSGTGRDQGAVKIVQALAQYGRNFDHADWRPLEH
ncbi:hypothetical protein [Bradyrhizobium japonicum]|uniref:hypothetical protein n=1 Tax=Bradyrhizobium japonicum TaxID=375 RepID=UPI0003FD2789|nr:hypothetical protein [Bradyrhizobium japonicum]